MMEAALDGAGAEGGLVGTGAVVGGQVVGGAKYIDGATDSFPCNDTGADVAVLFHAN